jgi:hypothetical protein
MIDGRDHPLHHNVGVGRMCLSVSFPLLSLGKGLTESTRPPETVQTRHVGVHVVDPAH